MRLDKVATQAFYVSLGKSLRGHRVLARMSAAELGRRVGISARYVQRIESAHGRCASHLLVAIATELDLSLDFDLFPVAVAEVRKSA